MKKIAVLLLCCAFSFLELQAKEDDKKKQQEKEQKKIEKLDERFQKKLKKNPNNAQLFWNHAKELIEYRSQIARASDFYARAIELDSTNGMLFKDFGKYWFNNRRDYDKASAMFNKAIRFGVNDDEMKPFLEIIKKVFKMRDEEKKLLDFGTTNLRTLNTNVAYKSITNFDSLKKNIEDPNSKNNYQKLYDRLINDDPDFTPADMYMLMVGYSSQKFYNPYNYNDINQLKRISNVDTAILVANELIKFYPVNPSINRTLMYLYRKKNDEATALKYFRRIRLYFDAMLYSGDGSCDKPYVTLWAQEEENFIAYLGNENNDEHIMGSCAGQMSEQLKMTNPETQKKEEINFNIQLIYRNAMK